VRYENQLIGTTDRGGHLLVPSVPSYYPAKYEIDPLGLPGSEIPNVVEQRVAVQRRSGAVVEFPIRHVVAARITLVDTAGRPLALGARVVHDESGQEAVVGWSGDTYLEGLAADNHLTVTKVDGTLCHASFTLDTGRTDPSHVGPLECHE
jgi:outer membrane usher protein